MDCSGRKGRAEKKINLTKGLPVYGLTLKNKAVRLRRIGKTLVEISKETGVSKSRLSEWLKGVELSQKINRQMSKRKYEALGRARVAAAFKRKGEQASLRNVALASAVSTVDSVPLTTEIQSLVLASLYLGDGFKRRSQIGFGNSNPSILMMYVRLLESVFVIPKQKMKCFLYLRVDQQADSEIQFWSDALGIPRDRFGKTQKDRRTLGKKTKTGYHGVCAVYCYDASVERRLTALQQALQEKILAGV